MPIPFIESHAPCPCESGAAFGDCCEALIQRKRAAVTALALMRSRYTAFVFKKWDYLVETTHPKTRGSTLRRQLEEMDDNPQWSGLKIVSTQGGMEEDKIGKVEFEASYFVDGEACVLEEHSRFRRFNGKWMYLDGKG